MKQLETIEKNLKELGESGAKFCLFKSKKYWILTYKDNEEAKADCVLGLSDIRKFVMNKCCELDSKTGIKA